MKTIWLHRPIPRIRLAYSRRPKKSDRPLNGLTCAQCGEKNIHVGSGGHYADGEQYVFCEDCAIDNYGYHYGFATRKAAEAHRRRMFDVQYLFLEILTDLFMEQRQVRDIDDLSDEQASALLLLAQETYNSEIPKRRKIILENTEEQDVIAAYLQKKAGNAKVFLSMIP